MVRASQTTAVRYERARPGELVVLMTRMREGRANTIRGAAGFLTETIGQVRTAGTTGRLTMRADSGFLWPPRRGGLLGDGRPLQHRHPLELEADHRRHAEIENTFRDLKYGIALNHLSSGRFAANGAWLAVQVLAHNLARWTGRLGLGAGIVTTKTLRRRLLAIPGRLTRPARRWTLHLPRHWPWAEAFRLALARLRAIPIAA